MEFPKILTRKLADSIRIFPTYTILRKTFDPAVELKRVIGSKLIPTLYYAFRDGKLQSINLLVRDLLKYKLLNIVKESTPKLSNLLVGRLHIGVHECETAITDGFQRLPIVFGNDLTGCQINQYDNGHRFDILGNVGYSDEDLNHVIYVDLDLEGIIEKYPETLVSVTGEPFRPLTDFIEDGLIANFEFNISVVGEINLLSFKFCDDLPQENYAIIVDQESTLCSY